MEALTFKLEDFEGPLDLLLHLISKNKMDLYNIPILALIDQYTTLINTIEADKLDAASEFIEMAARLVQMKSTLLLPRSEEAERLQQELTCQLIEYEACKRMAKKLNRLAADTYIAVRRPMEPEPDTAYRLHHEPSLLADAWNGLMGRSLRRRAPSQERFEPLVAAPFVSVGSRVVHLLRGLLRGRVRSLRQLFSRRDSRSQTVATFLAVLELVRAGRMTIGADESLDLVQGRVRGLEKGENGAWT